MRARTLVDSLDELNITLQDFVKFVKYASIGGMATGFLYFALRIFKVF